MSSFAVSAIGRDRPGIIAAVTEVLSQFALNIEDAHGGLLRGHFALMLICSGGDHVEEDDLGRSLTMVCERMGLESVSVSRVEDLGPEDPPSPTHHVTVHNGDRPGIVHAVCSALAAAGVSVIELDTRRRGDDPAVELGVLAPDEDAAKGAAARLDRIVAAAEVEIAFVPVGQRRGVGANGARGGT